MSRFLHIGAKVIHVPSVMQIFVGQNYNCNSVITIRYHNEKTEAIEYPPGKWADCDKDVERLKKCMTAVADVLSVIPEKEPELA